MARIAGALVARIERAVVASHTGNAPQPPQLATVRSVPQLSLAVSAPQAWPNRSQSLASDSGTQVGAHAPQLTCRERAQRSLATNAPQVLCSRTHSSASVSGVHGKQRLPLHAVPAGQLPSLPQSAGLGRPGKAVKHPAATRPSSDQARKPMLRILAQLSASGAGGQRTCSSRSQSR
jgi:hypothetical protein